MIETKSESVRFPVLMPRRAIQPSPRAARRLRQLYARKLQADDASRRAADELAAETLRVSEVEGASRRTIALLLKTRPSTVQGWIDRAKQLRDQSLD